MESNDCAPTSAHLADACLRLGIPMRSVSLRAVTPGSRLFGKAVPVRHFGSVDIFLEAIGSAAAGSVLVVDNKARCDEACIGDLVTLEALGAGLAGIVIWGYHRDTAEIRALGLPLFSMGATPAGPTRLDERDDQAFLCANFDRFSVSAEDYVVADDDGVLFVPAHAHSALDREARSIRDTEQMQAERARAGISLREQLRLADFIERRESTPGLTFRAHLQSLSGAIEE